MRSRLRTPLVVCIDVEPDKRQLDRKQPGEWHGVDPTSELLERWRTRLTQATALPAHFSWFWRADPQVAEVHGEPSWGLRRYRAMRVRTGSCGDAHGVHPHAWKWDASTSLWVHDHADHAWVGHCVATALDAFRVATGRHCRIIRLGDRWLDADTYRLLKRRHVRVDLSVEPGEPPVMVDSNVPLPDYSAVPTRPYRPDADDVTSVGRSRFGPVLFPLSAIVGAAPEGDGRRLRTLHPWRFDAPELALELLDAGAPYLAFATHTNLGVIPEFRDRLDGLLSAIADHPRASSLAVVTPTEALSILRVRRLRTLE